MDSLSADELEAFIYKAKPWQERCLAAAHEFVLWWNRHKPEDLLHKGKEYWPIFERHGLSVPLNMRNSFIWRTMQALQEEHLSSCLTFNIAHALWHVAVTEEMIQQNIN